MGQTGSGGTAPESRADHGEADPAIRQALLSTPAEELPILLAQTRLLLALHDLQGPQGQPGTSDGPQAGGMGLVTMINAQGLRGLLAFTGLDALQAWGELSEHRGARPLPRSAPECAALAREHECAALVIDVMGPHRRILEGAQLAELAGQNAPAK